MMENLVKILREGNHSLVVANGGIHAFSGRGISDLYNILIGNPLLLKGAKVADKVVGKGAAAVMIAGGVDSVYAEVISSPAMDLFGKSRIGVSYGRKVDNIINRTGDDICPVEKLCLSCATPMECLPLIEKFMTEGRSRS